MAPDRRLVVTLTPEPAQAAREIIARAGISPPEAFRRGLTLLDLVTGLRPDQEVVIRDRKTGATDRVVFAWR
jgi:hypothetical protein